MTARTPPSWLQNATSPGHKAENDRLVTEAFVQSEGVVTDGSLAVTHSSLMTVSVASGGAFIDGTENTYQGMYHAYNAAATSITLTAADATNPRVDIIVARIKDSQYSGTENAFEIVAIAGTPAASPAVPATPANALKLAEISVLAGATTVSGKITDKRYLATMRTPVVTSAGDPLATLGGMMYDDTGAKDEGLKIYNGSNWRPPWNVAWGEVASGSKTTASATLSTSATSPTSLITFSFIAVANRIYSVECFASFQASAADTGSELQLRQGDTSGTILQLGYHVHPVSAFRGSIYMVHRGTFSAGSVTLTMCGNRYVGSGDVTLQAESNDPAWMVVRDCGPSGAPT